jgi:hypothetical protein
MYSVWLFTRPLSWAVTFPPLASTSDGKDHLRHWGVLVNEMSLIDAQAILLRTKEYGANDNTELGTMYKLFRDEGDRNNVNITQQFGMATIRKEWQMFSVQYVGGTAMTHAMIKQEGMD